MSITLRDAGPGELVFDRVIGSLGSSIDIYPGEYSYKDTFDEDRDDGRLTIRVGDLTAAGGGKDGPDSGVSDSEGGSRMEMTPLSSPQSPAGTSDSGGVSESEVTVVSDSQRRRASRESLGSPELEV